jgi:hypothetical protein
MRLLCSTDSKDIYLRTDGKNVRIFHYYCEDDLFSDENYEDVLQAYELCERKLNGRLIKKGTSNPDNPIVYEMPYLGTSIYSILENNLMTEEDIVCIFELQLPTLILNFTNKNLVHNDIAFRNFTLDEEKKLHLVDYSSIQEFSHFCEIDPRLFVYLEADFEHLKNIHLHNRGRDLIWILKKMMKIN